MPNAIADVGTDEVAKFLAKEFRRFPQTRAQIDNALERMRDGNYGACEGCTKPIPLARLQALPYATTCIDCQRELESSGGAAPQWDKMVDAPNVVNKTEMDLS